ncbi:MAG: GHKL domain-containing protein [Clostridia bacterium]|nr:GHKL domain-containing protein [Clostridia bacterium]
MTFIFNSLACVFEAIIVFMYISEYTVKNENILNHTKLISILTLSVAIILSNTIFNLGLLNFVIMILSTFAISFIFSKSVMKNMILAIISILILAIAEIIVVFLIALVEYVTPLKVVTTENYKILGTIISKFIAFLIFKVLCILHKGEYNRKIKTSYWILFMIMFITSVITIFLIFELQLENISVAMHNLSLISSFGLLYSLFFALYLYENLSKQAAVEKQQEIFQQQIKAQSKHLDEILVTQKEIRKLRHDLNNHNISIKAYFESNDCKAGLEYLEGMNKMIDVSKDTIETGNVALDAIINTKRSIAISKNIEFNTHIQIPENIFIDPIDICIIFGNALDNCIEACEHVIEGVKRITVNMVYEDDSIICKISNTALKHKGKFLQTTKKHQDEHGFGIKNIETAISKYKNILRFNFEDNEFVLSFVIFNN